MPFYQFTVPTGNATLRHKPEIAEVRSRLIHGLAGAWCAITGDAMEDIAVFPHEVPGVNVLEGGQTLPEATEDPGAIF